MSARKRDPDLDRNPKPIPHSDAFELALKEYGLALERELQSKLFSSEDAKIGLNAYVEKAKPDFRGKWPGQKD